MKAKREILILEPFYSGSHKFLADFLQKSLTSDEVDVRVIGLEGRKWHWRMLASAPIFAGKIPKFADSQSDNKPRTLFVTSMVNLAELLGLRPDLRKSYTQIILYFHENQLEYPKAHQSSQNTFNLVYNQIISCLVADHVFFNSQHNKDTFLEKVDPFINKIPKVNRPQNVKLNFFQHKCSVLYQPISIPLDIQTIGPSNVLSIVWPHRWEHDKGTEMFMKVMSQLGQDGIKVKLSVLGYQESSSLEAFGAAKESLSSFDNLEILQWGSLESRDDYIDYLKGCDLVLSTAIHEFYGFSVLEAAFCGCFVLAPNALAYKEIFPKQCLYNTEKQLFKSLKSFCLFPKKARTQVQAESWKQLLENFSWEKLRPQWDQSLLNCSSLKRKRNTD